MKHLHSTVSLLPRHKHGDNQEVRSTNGKLISEIYRARLALAALDTSYHSRNLRCRQPEHTLQDGRMSYRAFIRIRATCVLMPTLPVKTYAIDWPIPVVMHPQGPHQQRSNVPCPPTIHSTFLNPIQANFHQSRNDSSHYFRSYSTGRFSRRSRTICFG